MTSTVEKLHGLILVNLTCCQYFDVCRYIQVHEILTYEHNNLPIFNNTVILKLVARTGNFIPIPVANSMIFNVRRSLNLFCVRMYINISKSIHRKLMEQGAEEARSAGLPNWRSRVFQHSDIMRKQQRCFLYSKVTPHGKIIKGCFQLCAQR